MTAKEPDADDYGYAGAMNPQMGRARKKAKKQLAVKATVPEGAKKVKVKAKVEMGKKGA